MFKAKTFRFAGQNKSFTAQNGKKKKEGNPELLKSLTAISH